MPKSKQYAKELSLDEIDMVAISCVRSGGDLSSPLDPDTATHFVAMLKRWAGLQLEAPLKMLSYSDVAKRYGVCEHTIRNWCDGKGVSRPFPRPRQLFGSKNVRLPALLVLVYELQAIGKSYNLDLNDLISALSGRTAPGAEPAHEVGAAAELRVQVPVTEQGKKAAALQVTLGQRLTPFEKASESLPDEDVELVTPLVHEIGRQGFGSQSIVVPLETKQNIVEFRHR